MKAGFTVLTGLLIANGLATIDVKPTDCQVSKVAPVDSFSCPCSGGSGSYDYHFSDVPEGWTVEKDKISAPKGKIADNKVYGCKVEVFDKVQKESVKKSLFFNFKDGKINQIAEHDFDFDVTNLTPNYRPVSGGAGKFQSNNVRDSRDDKVRKVFDGAGGIGGGCGLAKMRPYFLGKGGLYKGDNANPYLNRLPDDNELDRIVGSDSSSDVRSAAVNVARSKASCRDINLFMGKLL